MVDSSACVALLSLDGIIAGLLWVLLLFLLLQHTHDTNYPQTLDCWQGWQDRAQVLQSFWMAGHIKHWETILAIVFLAGWTWESNTWRRRGDATYGRGFTADVTQYSSTEVPGIRSFSSCRAVVHTSSVRSLSSPSWAVASPSWFTGTVLG